MLVLSRLLGESIYLFLEDGRRVDIKLLNFTTKYGVPESIIGIEAPKSILIMREEVFKRAMEDQDDEEYDIGHD